MGKVRNYVYTDLSARKSLTLEVEGAGEFEVVQYSSSWAANEIPTAAVMLALGRNARSQAHAKIHTAGRSLKQMQKATVWFAPQLEYDRDRDWPPGRRKIFDGYFTGFAYRKISGKVTVIGNLIHWLAALGFGSCLTKNGHVSNPTQLNAAAVLQSLASSGGGEGNYISLLVPAQLVAPEVTNDMWKAIKGVFCELSKVDTMPCGPQQECGGDGTFAKNDVAQDALGRIEGPAAGCDRAYRWGVPLKIETAGVSTIQDDIATAIGNETVESYSATTFWDKLVAQFCPMFGMAVVPMVETALLAADVPAYNGGHWKEVATDEYDSFDLTRELHRPLRAVGVVAGYESQARAGVEEPGDVLPIIGGCYAEDSVKPGDGTILYVPSPAWLRVMHTQPRYVGDTTGLTAERASKTATTPVDPARPSEPTPDALGINANKLYELYAHEVYVNQMLRGQGGSFSGKLRFDIAPLSILKLNATTEKFIGPGQDDLAATVYGCVQRVTVSINAEAGMAGTTFQLSHVRTERENQEKRTSVDRHPLFGTAIHGGGKHGSPLVDDYNFTGTGGLAGDGPVQPPPAA